ncbi:MAG: glycerol-3-phosphate 1-O-acyltransferase PlsY [Lachnospiraceae bacterium]|nr:glycerol-3-phosphate 1-O-acyltransferase PlsY [Lachnospiraceae bacterium]
MDNPYVARCLCILIGYLFGVFQTAYFYGRLKGIDIRKHGSGNAGTTNTLRVLGTKAGLIVLFGDMIKCILAIVVTTLIFRGIHPDMIYLLKIYTAAGCVLGHDFPFYMNFKGGKGIACTAGYLIAFHWVYIPIGLAAFFIPFLLTHFVSLGSLCLYTSFIVALGILGQIGFFGMEQMLLLEMYFIAFLMTVLAFWQHRANIGRLLHGNERKTFLFKKKDTSAEHQAEEKNR